MSVHVFTGPTLAPSAVLAELPDAVVHPPVRHGDLYRVGLVPGDTALIIDGLWHQQAPIRHKEILHAMDAGVQVAGAASMGALRAAELDAYGMAGIGIVYRNFRSGLWTADDEVAVVHTPEGKQLTEALANLRTAAERCARARGITWAQAEALVKVAAALPYTARSWRAWERAAGRAGLPEEFRALALWRETGGQYNLKQEDALLAVRQAAAGFPAERLPVDWQKDPWCTSFTRYWESQYAPAAPGAGFGFLPVLRYQQLYATGFPGRWTRHVLDRAGHIGPSTISPARAAWWLLGSEREQLADKDQVALAVVRASSSDTAWSGWPATAAEAGQLLTDYDTTVRAVGAAFAVAAEVTASGPGRSPAHLRSEVVGRALAAEWGLTDAPSAVLDAAARDRAFRSFAGALDAARPFHHYRRQAGVFTPV